MGRTIKGEVKLSEIEFDEELYPRTSYNWQTGYDYSQSMKVGAKFPDIILALYNGKKYLVDGKHRMEATKLLKKDSIKAIIHTGWNRERIYKEAVKSNITHGKGLSPYEKRMIAVKLMEMNCKDSEVSELIQIPMDKMESFIGQRLVNSITGEPITSEGNEKIAKEIGQAILKSGLKHFAGTNISQEDLQSLRETQRDFYAGSQLSLVRQLVETLENDLLDKENKEVMKLIKKLKELLKNY